MNPDIHTILKNCELNYINGDYYVDSDEGVIVVKDLPMLGKKLGKKWTSQTTEAEWKGFIFRRWGQSNTQ